jgi:hypothetical protein
MVRPRPCTRLGRAAGAAAAKATRAQASWVSTPELLLLGSGHPPGELEPATMALKWTILAG